MITLQETVHRECAEREQLKDALIDARQQLLTWKKNGLIIILFLFVFFCSKFVRFRSS